MINSKCCFIPCSESAEWTIVDESEPRQDLGYTESCTVHVGDLLGPSTYFVSPIVQQPILIFNSNNG